MIQQDQIDGEPNSVASPMNKVPFAVAIAGIVGGAIPPLVAGVLVASLGRWAVGGGRWA